MKDYSYLTDQLNVAQCAAVSATLGNYLVLAGAGSGKTRVLVHRIAWLMHVEQVSAYSLLAVTFTNKSAKEMRHRIDHLNKGDQLGMWIGTFHGLCHRLLRIHFREAKLAEQFQILDSDDQQRLLKRLIRAQNLDEKQWSFKEASWYINAKKDQGLRPKDIKTEGDTIEETWRQIYAIYQETCDRSSLVDFAEILLRCYELLRDDAFIRNHYQTRFQHILVDEFQDTNQIQYDWLRLLSGKHNHLMIVGDDDQSIYGWRGAQVENMDRFLSDYQATTIRLEQNYRSTATILNAANALIAHNTQRLGKELWTADDEGELISLYTAYNERDEASFIASRIKEWLDHGNSLADCAILYRGNAQSRILEDALLKENLPYRIYGGYRFFERLEIKDALAYLRLISNRNDDAAFERVVNRPARGIGDQTLMLLRNYARDSKVTLWRAAEELIQHSVLNGRAMNAIARFIELIDALEDATNPLTDKEYTLEKQTRYVIEHSGITAFYKQEKEEKSEARLENLEELVNAARDFKPSDEESEQTLLNAFLSHASLEAGDGQAEEYTDAVQLMTLHTAKGLEFPVVFMVGLEEGLFPSIQSSEDSKKLAEERRLCYVGITRAMSKLYLCHAQVRRIYGVEKLQRVSRFLTEIPELYLEPVRANTKVRHSYSFDDEFDQSPRYGEQNYPNKTTKTEKKQHRIKPSAIQQKNGGFAMGKKVEHASFGTGTIINTEGEGEKARVQVAFNGKGIKWLQLLQANLTLLS